MEENYVLQVGDKVFVRGTELVGYRVIFALTDGRTFSHENDLTKDDAEAYADCFFQAGCIPLDLFTLI